MTVCGHPVAGSDRYPCTEPPGHGILANSVEHRHVGGYAARSTPAEALDVRPLMQALRDYLFPRGIHHPDHWSLANEGARAIGEAAQTIERALSPHNREADHE